MLRTKGVLANSTESLSEWIKVVHLGRFRNGIFVTVTSFAVFIFPTIGTITGVGANGINTRAIVFTWSQLTFVHIWKRCYNLTWTFCWSFCCAGVLAAEYNLKIIWYIWKYIDLILLYTRIWKILRTYLAILALPRLRTVADIWSFIIDTGTVVFTWGVGTFIHIYRTLSNCQIFSQDIARFE